MSDPLTRARIGVRAQPRVGSQRREERLLEAVLGGLGTDDRPQRPPDIVTVMLEQLLEGWKALIAHLVIERLRAAVREVIV